MTEASKDTKDGGAIARHRYLEVLHQFTMSQASLTAVDDICWNIAKTAIGDLGFVDCVVYLLNDEGSALTQRAAHGDKNPGDRQILDPIVIPVGEGIVGSVAKSGQLQLVNDTRYDPRYILDDNFRCSELAVPILHDGRVVGVLDSEHPEPHFFSEEDVALFTTIASLASTRLDTALALERLEAQAIELEEARSAAEAASHAKSQFIASISHDMRTPLTAIIGYSHLLEEGSGSSEQRDKWQRAVISNAQYMNGVIGNILDMAAIERGQLSLTMDRIEVKAWVASLEPLIEQRAEQKGLSVLFIVDSKAPIFWVSDRAKLSELTMNLLINAIKYTMQGHVKIEVSKEAINSTEYLKILISDSGIGISSESLSAIFEPFVRVHDLKHYSKVEGTGLGLTVVKSFTEALQGKIHVESEVGKGTCVEVLIPSGERNVRLDTSSQIASVKATDPHLAQVETDTGCLLEARSILVCEDSQTVAMLIQAILERAGARVTVVENGALAIAAIGPDTDHFDAVVTDIQMPIIDGYELANQLRQLGWAKPIIALTALAAPEDKARCLAAGCSDYLTKPIDPADFPTALANAIRSHSQEAVMP